jgi:hypothetical protein
MNRVDDAFRCVGCRSKTRSIESKGTIRFVPNWLTLVFREVGERKLKPLEPLRAKRQWFSEDAAYPAAVESDADFGC